MSFRFLASLGSCVFLTACGVVKQGTRSIDQTVRNLVEQPDEPERPKPLQRHEKMVGSVSMVNAAGNFLLIQTPRGTTLPKGAELITYDDAKRRSARIRLSPEKKGTLYVADILQGAPAKGHYVAMEGITDENGVMIWGGEINDEMPTLSDDVIQVLE